MNQFKLASSQVVLPVMVEYQAEDTDIKTAVAYVSYGQDKVWFPTNPELDTDEMRRAILASLDTIFPPATPSIPPEIWDQIEQVRAGNYGHEIPRY